MGKSTVDLGFCRTPFMVQETGVAWTIFRFRAHTLLCPTSSIMAFVLQKFVTIDTLEFMLGELLLRLEFLSQRACQRIALHFPELRHLDTRGVEL